MSTTTAAPATLDLTAAASLLGVPSEALQAAAEHRLVPASLGKDGACAFTLDQISAIRDQQTRRAQTTEKDAAQGCCIDKDPDGNRLWCRKCAAEYCALSPKTLANLISLGTGPRVLGRLGAPRYRKADLDEWMG